jgi:membrane protein YdbS with pleckstrin-like domain
VSAGPEGSQERLTGDAVSSQTVSQLVVGVLVLGWLVYRQLRARPLRMNQRLLLILLLLGAIETYTYFQHGKHSASAAAVALIGSLVLAAAFGAVRAFTVRIWEQDGQPWVQGNLLTAALWVVAVAAHLGFDYLVGRHQDIGDIGNATVVLYLVVSLGVQRAVMTYRAQRMNLAPVAR